MIRKWEELPENARIRLCIGIYREPRQIALTDKKSMKEKLITSTKRLFEKKAYIELATHDEKYLERFFREIVIPEKISPDQFEIQMLLGVPRKEIQRRILNGEYTEGKPVNVRLYVPFAEHRKNATAYCRRRLIANPDIIGYGIKNMFGRIFGSETV